MNNRIDKIAGQLADLIKGADAKATGGYDTPATVKRIDGDTAWVHIPGGIDETPVKLTIAAKEGDTVQTRVSGGRAWLVGNQTAPPTDDATAIQASDTAHEAKTTAKVAEGTAEEAKAIAEEALKNAGGDTPNYFWHKESGSDSGSHITQITQEEFEKNPNQGGGNVRVTSASLAIRDGLTELATFSGDGVQIGETSGSHTTMDTEAFRQYGSDGVKRLEIGDTDTGNYIYEGINRTFTDKGTFTISKNPKQGTPIYVVIDTFVDTTWELKQHHVLLTAGTSGSGQNTEYNGARTFTITPLAAASPTKVRLVIYAVEGQGSAYTFGERNEANNTPYGEKSMAIGSDVMAYAPNSMAVGVGATASYPGQVALGRYPFEDEAGTFALLIGNGSDSDNPGVAGGFTWDGDVYLALDTEAKAGTTDAKLQAAITKLKWYDALV